MICYPRKEGDNMTYKTKLLNGVYGQIQNKHKELARIIKAKKLNNYSAISDYIYPYKKYNNWTLRDIDKAIAYANK